MRGVRWFALLVVGTLTVVRLGAQPGPAENLSKTGNQLAVVIEQVRFRHGQNVLAGSLYRPVSRGPHLAVALVLGSGAQDRNYGGTGPALGNHFARHGFVCLTWDKP